MAEQPDAPAAPPPAAAAAAAAAAPAFTLTEDEADDLLYCARTGDLAELQATLAAAVARVGGDDDDDDDDDGKETAANTLAVLAAARDGSQNTALHMAAANGHAAVVQCLLGAAAQAPGPPAQAFVDAANAFGNTALHWAALNGRLDVVRLLVAGPPRCAVALANDKNYIALDLASLHGHGAVAAYFMAEAEGRAAREGGQNENETEGQNKTAEGPADATTAAAGLSTATAALDLQDGQ